MMTPQDIREKTFEKAVFGGYDMSSVDTFLEELANDLTLLQKENAVLKGKMKVLVDKVEEYRGNEDALRMAVLSAQKLGNMIEAEAREKADTILNDAKTEAARVTQEAALEVNVEKARLEESKAASAQFIDNMNLLCRRQMSFLEKVGEMDFMQQLRTVQTAETDVSEAESAEMHETVKSIEETVDKAASAPESVVHPSFAPAVAVDDLPTKAFNIVSDPEDDVEKTTLFSFQDLH